MRRIVPQAQEPEDSIADTLLRKSNVDPKILIKQLHKKKTFYKTRYEKAIVSERKTKEYYEGVLQLRNSTIRTLESEIRLKDELMKRKEDSMEEFKEKLLDALELIERL